jgi:hypothetical protein
LALSHPLACLGRSLAQFGDARLSSLGALGAAIEYVRQKLLKTLGLQQTVLDVLCDQIVEFSIGTVQPGQRVSPWRDPLDPLQTRVAYCCGLLSSADQMRVGRQHIMVSNI